MKEHFLNSPILPLDARYFLTVALKMDKRNCGLRKLFSLLFSDIILLERYLFDTKL